MKRYVAIIAAALVAIGAWVWYYFKRDKPELEPPVDYGYPWGELLPIDRVIILGIPYTGKTYFAAKLTKSARRVLYFDPYGDYHKAAGAVEFTVDELLASPEVLEKPRFKISVRPSTEDDKDTAYDLDRVVNLARDIGEMVVVLDEVGDYALYGQRTLNKLFRNGRHDGIVTVLVSQVATDIPRTCRRIATRIYSFLQTDPADLDALREKCGEEFVAKILAMKDRIEREQLKDLTGMEPAAWYLPTIKARIEDNNE